jgi:EmrB/QacA subfamily drug resistance transporter
MLARFIEKTLETATGQNLSSHTPPSSEYQNIDLEKKGDMDIVVPDVESTEDKIPEWKPQRHEWMVMITLATISLMVALDATILVPVLPTLAVDLHGNANEALWTGTSYLLTSAVFQPFIAAISDIFGRRELLLPSLLSFTAGTIVCCLAHSFPVMLAGRCIQGIGGGGIITLSQVIFADIIPLRQRPKYFSVVLGAWAFGSVLGPFIGGLFVEKATWRWCFYLNFPFCGIGFPMILFLIPLKTAKTSLKAKLLRVDWLGGFLFIGGLTSFLIAITCGGVQFSWSSWRTLVPLTVGPTAMIAAFAWERYGAVEPFLRRSLFRTLSNFAAYLCALLQGLLLFAALYYMPFYLTSVLSKSPIHSGLDLFPATCLLLPGSAVVSLLITRLGHFRVFVWLGWIISTAGAGLLILLNARTKTWYWALVFAVFGLGMGMILSSVNFATQANAKVRDAGRAAAMYAFMRSLGMAVGVAISGSVFQNLMSSKLAGLGLETDIAKNAESYVAVLRKLEVENPPAASDVLSAYVRGFWGVWVVMTGICGLGLVLSMCVKHGVMERRLDSQYTLDRTSRSSKFLEGAWVGERAGRGLEQQREGGGSGDRRDVLSMVSSERVAEPEAAVGRDERRPVSERVTEPEAAVVRESRSPVSEATFERPLSQEVFWDGRAKDHHGEGPIWGVS